MTLRFYVRGSSANDILFLKSTIASRQTLLAKNINDRYIVCSKDPTCSQKNALQVLNRKITEFTKGTSNKKVSVGTELAYSLAAQLDSIKSMEDELKKIK